MCARVKLKLHLFDLLWICCKQVESHTPLFRFVYILTCRDVDLLWICCTKNPQQIEQVKFELKASLADVPVELRPCH
jgi:hypothetical protein